MKQNPKTFTEVLERDSCRYIGGTDAAPTYCGNKRQGSGAWCAEHRAVVYVKKQKGQQDGQA